MYTCTIILSHVHVKYSGYVYMCTGILVLVHVNLLVVCNCLPVLFSYCCFLILFVIAISYTRFLLPYFFPASYSCFLFLPVLHLSNSKIMKNISKHGFFFLTRCQQFFIMVKRTGEYTWPKKYDTSTKYERVFLYSLLLSHHTKWP